MCSGSAGFITPHSDLRAECPKGWATLCATFNRSRDEGPLPMPDLFDPLRVRNWDLPNRLVMAPLTRNRAAEGMVPSDLAVEYYRQRASAGLIITEGTQPGAAGQGDLGPPDIHSPAQGAAGRRVAGRVHAEGAG